jgi:hypothetical protein
VLPLETGERAGQLSRSSRRRAVRWRGASAPRFSATLRVAPLEREGAAPAERQNVGRTQSGLRRSHITSRSSRSPEPSADSRLMTSLSATAVLNPSVEYSTNREKRMFTWINKQGVRSSEGFEVQSTGRFTIEYREAGRVITVYVEDGYQGGPCVDIADNAFQQWDHSALINSLEEQARLLRNFKRAIAFQGVPVCV